jgi:hypothetical protein
MPASSPRTHAASVEDGDDCRDVQPIKERRARPTARGLRPERDSSSEAIRGISHRARDD